MEYLESIVPSGGGLNYDDDERVMENGDGRSREHVMLDTEGTHGNLVGVRGTALCLAVIPFGRNAVFVGSCKDYDNDAVIAFYVISPSPSEKYGCIVRVYDEDNYEVLLYEDMGWSTTDRVQASYMDGKLFWSVGGNTYKANAERLRLMTALRDETVHRFDGVSTVTVEQGDYVYVVGSGMYRNDTSSVVTVEESLTRLTFVNDMYWDVSNYPEQIMLIKQPPLATVEVFPRYKDELSENLLANGGVRFTYCYVYQDDELSVYAAPSRLVTSVPEERKESSNAVDIKLTRGNGDVKAVRVLVQDVMTNTWYRIGDVLAKDFGGSNTYLYEYTGASRQDVVPNSEVDRPFDSVPVKAEALTSINNAVVLSNLTEGYDVPEVSIQAEVLAGEAVELITGDNWPHSFEENPIPGEEPDMKTFRSGYVRLKDVGETDVVPLGVVFTLKIRAYFGGTIGLFATKTVGTVEADGVMTGGEFREEVMALYNKIHTERYNLLPIKDVDDIDHPLNVWATYRYSSDGVGFAIIYGVRGQVLDGNPFTLDYLEENNFRGRVNYSEGFVYEIGDDNFYSFLSPSYPENVESDSRYHTETLTPPELSPTYKTFGVYDVAVRCYDEYKRSMPSVNKETIEITGDYGMPKVLDVTVGNLPSWAKYYSVCTSACNISDSAAVRLSGGGRLSFLEGSGSDYIVEMNIGGIPADVIRDDGTLAWAVGRVLPQPTEATSGNLLVIANTIVKEDGTLSSDPYLTVTGYAAMFSLRTGLESIVVNGEACYRIDMWGGYVYSYGENPVLLDSYGYVIVKKDIPLLDPQTGRFATPIMNEAIEMDGGYEHSFDIASYVNMVRTNLTPEKNVYLPTKGDYVRIVEDGAGNEKNVVGRVESIEEGRVVATEEESLFASYFVRLAPMDNQVSLEDGGFVEFYRMSSVDTNTLHEETVLRDVSETQAIVRNGDCWTRYRKNVGTNGVVMGESYRVEDFRFSDVIDSKAWAVGRVHVVDAEAKQKHIPVAMRYSGKLFEGTRINDTCRFMGGDITYLDSSDGDIQIAVPIGEQMLRVLQTSRRVTVDIGVAQRVSPDGTEEFVVSDRFFGSKRKSLNRWGTQNPEGVIEVNGNLYYFDVHTGQMIRDGQSGQHPISGKVSMGEWSHDYKMHTYFKRWREAWTESTRIALGSDLENDMVYVTFSSLLDEPRTIGFNEKRNRWVSSYDILPMGYQNIGRKLFSFQGGNVWMHNQGERRKLYGAKRPVRIGLVFNSQPSLMKLLDSIALKMTEVDVDKLPDDFIEVNIHPSPSYPEGMRTYVTKEMLRLEENAYRSYIMRNVLTPGMEDEMDAFFDGEEMRGYSGTVLIDFGDSDVVFTLCELGMTVSK